jgi:hypothetical protein
MSASTVTNDANLHVPAEIVGKRPRPATAAAVLQLALGIVTAPAGFAFSIDAGGAWAAVAAPMFAIALPLWLYAGIGLLRGSARAWRTGLAMLAAMLAFGVYKIAWVHESAAYLFQGVTLCGLALQLRPVTRRWVSTRRSPVDGAARSGGSSR